MHHYDSTVIAVINYSHLKVLYVYTGLCTYNRKTLSVLPEHVKRATSGPKTYTGILPSILKRNIIVINVTIPAPRNGY